jgi:hypothetical protein
VARTGRFKWLIFAALVTTAVGLWLLSNLHADMPIPVVWAWMFVAGIGIGPTFAVFTLVVQNSVPIARLGTATSNLTFFQQVGGTVGLAVTGTIFASAIRDQLPQQMGAGGVPPDLIGQVLAGAGAQMVAVGDLGRAVRPSHHRGEERSRLAGDREHVPRRHRCGDHRGARRSPAP